MPPQVSRSWDVLCLGVPLAELREDEPGVYRRTMGGAMSNVGIAVVRSGGSAACATRIGTDALGDRFMDLWAAEGLDATCVIRDAAAPTGYVLVHRDGAADRPDTTAAALMRPGDLSAETLARARVLHLSAEACAISAGAAALAQEAAGLARAAGTRVSLDLGADASGSDARTLPALLGLADIVLGRFDRVAALVGAAEPDAVLDRIMGHGPQVVAVTLPQGGAHVATAQARRAIAPMQAGPVDPRGAADTFAGYFLSALTAGDDLIEAALRATAAAAFATTRTGILGGIPGATDLPGRRA